MSFTTLMMLFIFMPLVELSILLRVGAELGPVGVLLLVVGTGAAGAALARWQGVQLLLKLRRELAQGHMPAPYLVDGVMILIAGFLLLTPGLLTDTIGFLLLIPVCRAVIKAWLKKKFEQKFKIKQNDIDVTYEEH